MIKDNWEKLPQCWKLSAYKNWLLFIKKQFPLSTFLWDDSYGLDFLICKELNIESNDPEKDLRRLDEIITKEIKDQDIATLDAIFSMQFMSFTKEINYLSPMIYFPNTRVLDFHCTNESMITDFSPLQKLENVFVLDYSDYIIIDFDKDSNIRDFNNIHYVKCNGMPEKEINCILKDLRDYKI